MSATDWLTPGTVSEMNIVDPLSQGNSFTLSQWSHLPDLSNPGTDTTATQLPLVVGQGPTESQSIVATNFDLTGAGLESWYVINGIGVRVSGFASVADQIFVASLQLTRDETRPQCRSTNKGTAARFLGDTPGGGLLFGSSTDLWKIRKGPSGSVLARRFLKCEATFGVIFRMANQGGTGLSNIDVNLRTVEIRFDYTD